MVIEQNVSRPPLRYYGGKWRLAPWIIDHFPEHRVYVEVFGGAAGVLLRKPVAPIEIYNDIDSIVVNFFKILRDQKDAQELSRLIKLTPFSREEFELSFEPTNDPLESARRLVVHTYFGFGSSTSANSCNGFRACSIKSERSYAQNWGGIPNAIIEASKRFASVTIEHLGFAEIISKYDSPKTLFYCDPPYPFGSRNVNHQQYSFEMSDMDHKNLACLLRNVKASVIVSGYKCLLYDSIYSGWGFDSKETTANGQFGSVPRTEYLWIKPFSKQEATPNTINKCSEFEF